MKLLGINGGVPTLQEANPSLSEQTANFTAVVDRHYVARSTNGVLVRATMPTSPTVGDRLIIQCPYSSSAPISLISGNQIQGASTPGWVKPGETQQLIYTNDLGWLGSSNLRNLIDYGGGGLEAGATDGAWTTLPTNLQNALDGDPATWTTSGRFDTTSGSTAHYVEGWINPQNYQPSFCSYLYCRYRMSAVAGNGGDVYVTARIGYYGGAYTWGDDFFAVPTSGQTTRTNQWFLSQTGHRAGIIFAKNVANAYSDIEFNTLVIL